MDKAFSRQWILMASCTLYLAMTRLPTNAQTSGRSKSVVVSYRVTTLYTDPTHACWVTSINNRSEITGSSFIGKVGELGSADERAFVWFRGQQRLLPIPNSYEGTLATRINAHGTVLGIANTGKHAIERACFWANGTVKLLPAVPGLDIVEGAYITNKDMCVCVGLTHNSESRSFLFSGEGMHELTTPKASNFEVLGMSDDGTVIGSYVDPKDYTQHACFGTVGKIEDLPSLSGHDGSKARAINGHGLIVGMTEYGTIHRRACLWQHKKIVALEMLAGYLESEAAAVNLHGIVVGHSYTLYNDSVRACVWVDHKVHDLNTMIPPHSGWMLKEAVGINDKGEIVGNGVYKGHETGFLLTPVSKKL